MLDLTARLAEAGVHQIPLLTPFRIGAVNTYLVEGERPTLIDCGPNAATALNELEAGLAAHGLRLGDLHTIVVTHQHLDHCGLAGPIVARTGVEVACLDALAPALEVWLDHATRDDDFAVELMLRHGVDPDVARTLRDIADVYRTWGQPVTVARRLADGERTRLAAVELEVLHRPGHSPSDTLLHAPGLRVAFGGDHLLAAMASTAFLSLPLDSVAPRERPRPLLEYRASLRATRALDVDVVLGGHGPPVDDHRALIDERLARHESRAARFLELLGAEAMSAHQLATAQWGPIAVTQAFATLSEVLGHLDLLLDEGAIVEEDDGSLARFRRA